MTIPVRMILASERNQLATTAAGVSGFHGGMLWPINPQKTMKTDMKTGPFQAQKRQYLNSFVSPIYASPTCRLSRQPHLRENWSELRRELDAERPRLSRYPVAVAEQVFGGDTVRIILFVGQIFSPYRNRVLVYPIGQAAVEQPIIAAAPREVAGRQMGQRWHTVICEGVIIEMTGIRGIGMDRNLVGSHRPSVPVESKVG